MPPVARTGDLISHGGTVTSNQAMVMADSLAICRVGDPATCNVHGVQTITTGSTTTKVVGAFAARIGDLISCGATITTGSATTSVS